MRDEAIGTLAEQEGNTAKKAKDELRQKNRELNSELVNLKLQMEGVGARAAKAEKQLSALQSKHSALNVHHDHLKKNYENHVRQILNWWTHACAKAGHEVAVAEARGLQMETYQREACETAAQLQSAQTELTDFQSCVCTLQEVRSLFYFSVSDVQRMCLTLPILCSHWRERQQNTVGRRVIFFRTGSRRRTCSER
jgi:chromosome segregation ATPase